MVMGMSYPLKKRAEVIELYNTGKSILEISHITHISQYTVGQWIRQAREPGYDLTEVRPIPLSSRPKRLRGREIPHAVKKSSEKRSVYNNAEKCEEVITLFNSGMTVPQVAEKAEICVANVYRILHNSLRPDYELTKVRADGSRIAKRTRYTEEEKKQMVELYNQGLSMQGVADKMHIPVGTVSVMIKKIKAMYSPPIKPRQVEPKSAPLKEETKQRIIELYESGMPLYKIQTDSSVHRGYATVKNVVDEYLSQQPDALNVPEEKQQKIREMYNRAVPAFQIANEVDIPYRIVNRVISAYASSKGFEPVSDDAAANAAILQMYRSGVAINRIAAVVHRNNSTVAEYLRSIDEHRGTSRRGRKKSN